MAQSRDTERPVPEGSSSFWIHAVSLSLLFSYLFALFLRAKPSDHLNRMYILKHM